MKYSLLFLFSILLVSCTSKSLILDQEYLIDLPSVNNRINGELYRYEFNNDLRKLTFDYYLKYLSSNERYSGQGTYKKIVSADKSLFKAQKNFFVITLYYENENRILSDNSNTPYLDTIIVNPNIVDESYLTNLTNYLMQK